jgi:mycothiol synthase
MFRPRAITAQGVRARAGGHTWENARVVRDGDRIVGYGAVRVFRELRIELEAPRPAPEWPDGLRVVPFDLERDALEFHAAHQEAFADHWDYAPRDFESWSKGHLGSARFDPTSAPGWRPCSAG